jgi:AhpD family alkylhydroperoxidase
MKVKLDAFAVAPALMKQWQSLAAAISSGLDPKLSLLVKIRASQINGCANCINMHAVHAREIGETEQRIYLLPAWQEAPCYTERERAALAWTEALTRLSDGHTDAPDETYEALQPHFSEEDRVKLTMLINAINGWNRIMVGFGGWVDPATLKTAAKAAAA